MNVSSLPSHALKQISVASEPLSSAGGLTPHSAASLEELARAHPEAAAAARQFESVFLRQLLGSVDKMSSVGAGSKTQGEVVGSMMKGVLAEQMSAAGGIGLAEVVLRSLTDGLSPAPPPHPLSPSASSAEPAPTASEPAIETK